MFHRGLGEAHDMQAKAGLGQPLRHEPAQNAPFICLPEIAGRGLVKLAALTGDDKHVPKAVRLAASEEAPQNDIGILLPQAMKIEPSVDRMAAACNFFADARIERRMWRRWSGI